MLWSCESAPHLRLKYLVNIPLFSGCRLPWFSWVIYSFSAVNEHTVASWIMSQVQGCCSVSRRPLSQSQIQKLQSCVSTLVSASCTSPHTRQKSYLAGASLVSHSLAALLAVLCSYCSRLVLRNSLYFTGEGPSPSPDLTPLIHYKI